MTLLKFITVLSLVTGFCSLQHGCHWRRWNSVQGRVRSPYGDTEQERRGRTTGIHAGTSGDACRNHSHRFVRFSVTTGDQHYECTVSGTHLSHCSLADLYMYCRTHLYGIIACIEWILWSLELIMHSFYTCCTELWIFWTYFFVPMKFQYIRSRL